MSPPHRPRAPAAPAPGPAPARPTPADAAAPSPRHARPAAPITPAAPRPLAPQAPVLRPRPPAGQPRQPAAAHAAPPARFRRPTAHPAARTRIPPTRHPAPPARGPGRQAVAADRPGCEVWAWGRFVPYMFFNIGRNAGECESIHQGLCAAQRRQHPAGHVAGAGGIGAAARDRSTCVSTRAVRVKLMLGYAASPSRASPLPELHRRGTAHNRQRVKIRSRIRRMRSSRDWQKCPFVTNARSTGAPQAGQYLPPGTRAEPAHRNPCLTNCNRQCFFRCSLRIGSMGWCSRPDRIIETCHWRPPHH